MNQFDVAKAKQLYESGLSYSQIGKLMGRNFQYVHQRLQKESVQSRGFGLSGDKNPAWKGGTTIEKKNGYTSYVLIYSPDHPYKNKDNKVREHRLVLEKYLGRYLKPEEVVDHIDGNGLNNKLSNLKLYASNAEHLKATKKGCVPLWTPEGRQKIKTAVRRYAKVRSDVSLKKNLLEVSLLVSKFPPHSEIPEYYALELRRLLRCLRSQSLKRKKLDTSLEDQLSQLRIFLKTCRKPSRRNPHPVRTIV